MNAFSAESIIRSCNQDSKKIIEALNCPKHSTYKKLILGAIHNVTVLKEILEFITDSNLLRYCIEGECGEFSKQWADRKCQIILNKLREEICQLKFKVSENSLNRVTVVPETLLHWTPQDISFINAFPFLLCTGLFLDEFYEMVTCMEVRLEEAFSSLAEEAKSLKIPFRSSLFAAGFTDQNSSIRFSKVSAHISLQHFSIRGRDLTSLNDWIKSKLSAEDISNGQLMVLSYFTKTNFSNKNFENILPKILEEKWRILPYQLLIELLDIAHRSADFSETQKEELLMAIQSIDSTNIWISTSVVDALKSLGGIEDCGYEATVNLELEKIFSDTNNPENWQLAQAMYNRQFDHPYDHIYWKVLNELSALKKKQFLIMAVRYKDDFQMFVGSMIMDLFEFADKETAQYIEHWIELASRPQMMPQDIVKVFVIAYTILGQLNYILKNRQYDSCNEDNAINAIGEIYYWINRSDMSLSEKKNCCLNAWDILMKHDLGLSVGTLYECEESLGIEIKTMLEKSISDISIFNIFTNEICKLCREALHRGKIQKSNYYRWNSAENIMIYAIQILGKYGEKIDTMLLRKFTESKSLASAAIKSIHDLEKINPPEEYTK